MATVGEKPNHPFLLIEDRGAPVVVATRENPDGDRGVQARDRVSVFGAIETTVYELFDDVDSKQRFKTGALVTTQIVFEATRCNPQFPGLADVRPPQGLAYESVRKQEPGG